MKYGALMTCLDSMEPASPEDARRLLECAEEFSTDSLSAALRCAIGLGKLDTDSANSLEKALESLHHESPERDVEMPLSEETWREAERLMNEIELDLAESSRLSDQQSKLRDWVKELGLRCTELEALIEEVGFES